MDATDVAALARLLRAESQWLRWRHRLFCIGLLTALALLAVVVLAATQPRGFTSSNPLFIGASIAFGTAMFGLLAAVLQGLDRRAKYVRLPAPPMSRLPLMTLDSGDCVDNYKVRLGDDNSIHFEASINPFWLLSLKTCATLVATALLVLLIFILWRHDRFEYELIVLAAGFATWSLIPSTTDLSVCGPRSASPFRLSVTRVSVATGIKTLVLDASRVSFEVDQFGINAHTTGTKKILFDFPPAYPLSQWTAVCVVLEVLRVIHPHAPLLPTVRVRGVETRFDATPVMTRHEVLAYLPKWRGVPDARPS